MNTANEIEIYLNSEVDKLPSETPSRWTTFFNEKIELVGSQKYELQVQSVSVPNVFPAFNSKERQIEFSFSGEPIQSVEVDKSRVYQSISDLVLYLTSLLGTDIEFSINTETQRMVIKNNSGKTVYFYNDGDNHMFFKKLGFTKAMNNVSGRIQILAGAQVEGEYLPVLIATQRVYITCDQIINNSITPSKSTPSILACVDLTGSFGSFSNYIQQNNNFFRHIITSTSNLNYLSFSVLDDTYEPIEMLGSGVRLSLVLRKMEHGD